MKCLSDRVRDELTDELKTTSQIAKALGVSVVDVSNSLSHMADRGEIDRVPNMQNNRMRWRLKTQAGEDPNIYFNNFIRSRIEKEGSK